MIRGELYVKYSKEKILGGYFRNKKHLLEHFVKVLSAITPQVVTKGEIISFEVSKQDKYFMRDILKERFKSNEFKDKIEKADDFVLFYDNKNHNVFAVVLIFQDKVNR
ncbi:hypothetical protein [Thermococcus paralvinellae]|uniref:hypothetical protein n=1 Tax=Thermococcus paralvinellae TaxID=582419 RepID=UPI0005B288D4|nr:hypothetical protein [Thermococcus paralvinellae]